MRRLAFFAATLLALLLLLELASFAFFRLARERLSFFDPEAYTADDRVIQDVLPRIYDRDLGWKTRHATAHGERPVPTVFRADWLATFGDSFTYGDGVADGETWQVHLARRTGANVLNFGNPGYGTDQAFLRFRQDYPEVRTPVVALGLITENINRIVNVYRPFYYPRTGFPATKPRFVLDGGQLELLPNPIESVHELHRLADPRFLERIGRDDTWFNPRGLPRRGPPYAAILFHPGFWRQLPGVIAGRVGDVEPRPWENLWDEAGPRELMFSILDRFAAEARAQGAEPLILILPREQEVLHRLASGRGPTAAERLRAFAGSRALRAFDAIEALGAAASDAAEVESWFDEHLTAEGNRVLAERLHGYLLAERLTPEPGVD